MRREIVIEAYLMNSPKVVAEMLYDTIERYENRTCESCKHNNNQCVLQTIIYNYDCSMDLSRFCCNKYEPKENR